MPDSSLSCFKNQYAFICPHQTGCPLHGRTPGRTGHGAHAVSLCGSSCCGPVPSCTSSSNAFLNTTATRPRTVISGSRSTLRCNQLCGEDVQRRYKVGNDDACAVCIGLFYSSPFPYIMCFISVKYQHKINCCLGVPAGIVIASASWALYFGCKKTRLFFQCWYGAMDLRFVLYCKRTNQNAAGGRSSARTRS